MAHLSILGTGNMGQAIAAVAGKGGHTVQLLGENDTDTPVSGDIVVLAVPYPAVADVIAQRGDSLSGKIVVDITNPLNFETFDSLTVPADSSATAEIAEMVLSGAINKELVGWIAQAGAHCTQCLSHSAVVRPSGAKRSDCDCSKDDPFRALNGYEVE